MTAPDRDASKQPEDLDAMLREPEVWAHVKELEDELALTERDPSAGLRRSGVTEDQQRAMLERLRPRVATPSRTGRRALAAAAAIIPLLLLTAGVVIREQFQELQRLRKSAGLLDYVEWTNHDGDHPSVDPGRALPFVAAEHSVILQGRVRPDVIRRIHVSFEPGLLPNQARHEVEIDVKAEAGDPAPVHFVQVFEVPADNLAREAKVVLEPWPHAREAAGEDLRPERLTFPRSVLSTASGVCVAASRPVLGPEVLAVTVDNQEAKVRLRTRSHKDSAIGLAYSVNGGRLTPAPTTQWVAAYGQELTMSVQLGAPTRSYEIRTYALTTGGQEALQRALQAEEFDRLSAGDTAQVRPLMLSTGRVVVAGHSADVRIVDPSLVRDASRDFWVAIVPLIDLEQVWVQQPVSSTNRTAAIQIGAPDQIGEARYRVVLFSFPKDAVRVQGVMSQTRIRELGGQVIDDALEIIRK